MRRVAEEAGHSHLGASFLQSEQTGTPAIPEVNPSKELPPTYFPKPNPTPKIKTTKAKRIWGVNLTGIMDATILTLGMNIFLNQGVCML
jgi:hypothetical protein